jgi:hypothetical protein
VDRPDLRMPLCRRSGCSADSPIGAIRALMDSSIWLGPLRAHPRHSRCLMLRSKSDVRSGRSSACSKPFSTYLRAAVCNPKAVAYSRQNSTVLMIGAPHQEGSVERPGGQAAQGHAKDVHLILLAGPHSQSRCLHYILAHALPESHSGRDKLARERVALLPLCARPRRRRPRASSSSARRGHPSRHRSHNRRDAHSRRNRSACPCPLLSFHGSAIAIPAEANRASPNVRTVFMGASKRPLPARLQKPAFLVVWPWVPAGSAC